MRYIRAAHTSFLTAPPAYFRKGVDGLTWVGAGVRMQRRRGERRRGFAARSSNRNWQYSIGKASIQLL